MGSILTLHGCIFCYIDKLRDVPRRNAEVIRSLPEEDPHPPLTRNMFAITAMEYPEPGLYKYQMIHFGASMRGGDGEDWDVWLRKFERLLARMWWSKVELRLELENPPAGSQRNQFDYLWHRDGGADSSEWRFSGGPRQFGEERPRIESWLPGAEEELRLNPRDVEALVRLFVFYDRLGEDDKAREMVARLREVDPERAASLEGEGEELSEIQTEIRFLQEARAALRDIVYMYYDLRASYQGFGRDIDMGSFDPVRFVDAFLDEPDAMEDSQIQLLQQGSGIAMLCNLYDRWSQNQINLGIPRLRRIHDALEAGRLRHLPDIEAAVRLGFSDEKAFHAELPGIYSRHVRGFFESLQEGSVAEREGIS